MLIDNSLIEQGYISKRKHPEFDYYIYNYTQKTQYEQLWNEDTMQCRGLILDGEGNVIARPFKKFFNLQEYGENSHLGKLPKFKSFDVYEKLDGSLGIAYLKPNDTIAISTRGSFESEQAIKATHILNNKKPEVLEFIKLLSQKSTLLFEIIYPKNRIVVDYGDVEDIILLAVIEKSTGIDMSYILMQQFCEYYKIKYVRRFNYMDNLSEILLQMKELNIPNFEGYVVLTNTGFRFKLKYAEYTRLHKILTGVSNKTIWELLRNNQDMSEILEMVPDEFYSWVKEQKKILQHNYTSIEYSCKVIISNLPSLTNSEKYGIVNKVASEIKQEIYSSVLFAMWRGKPYSEIIWKMIKPTYEKPFSESK